MPANEAYPRAIAAAQRAIALDDSLSRKLTVRSHLRISIGRGTRRGGA